MRDDPPVPMQTFMRTGFAARQRASVLLRTAQRPDDLSGERRPMASLILSLRHRRSRRGSRDRESLRKPANSTTPWGMLSRPHHTTTDGRQGQRLGQSAVGSAPQDDGIEIATHLRDFAFERLLASVPIEPRVRRRTRRTSLRQDASQRGRLSDGTIGVAPFRSMSGELQSPGSSPTRSGSSRTTEPEDATSLTNSDSCRRDATSSLHHFVPTMTDIAKSHRSQGKEHAHRWR